MGQAKAAMMREEELGWSPGSESFVCAECIEDEALAAVVADNVESKTCTFCGVKRRKAFAAPLDTVTEHMAECIYQEYTEPVNELPYDSEDDKWMGEVLDAFDLLADIGFEVENEELFEEVREAFSGREWCHREAMALTPIERRQVGWDNFKQAVKHQRRYTFWSITEDGNDEYHPGYLPVGQMLAEIGDLIREAKLVKLFGTRRGYWRVRTHAADKKFTMDHELSPPPQKLAVQANRMSPAGISMFYGAEDFETACYETIDPNSSNELVTGVKFKPLRKLKLLDLVNLPPIPSFFDENASDARHSLAFLYGFVRDVTQPIARDLHHHIEYVPTQAFTEYVRYMMRAGSRKPIDGIRYPSSKNNNPCVVLFCGQDECIEEPEAYGIDRWMSMDFKSLRTVKLSELPPISKSKRGGK